MANLSLTARAARISTKSPSGATLLLKLSEAKSNSEIQRALEEYDQVSAST
jgi:hypothetical protein